jgi:hypothetical protein
LTTFITLTHSAFCNLAVFILELNANTSKMTAFIAYFLIFQANTKQKYAKTEQSHLAMVFESSKLLVQLESLDWGIEGVFREIWKWRKVK